MFNNILGIMKWVPLFNWPTPWTSRNKSENTLSSDAIKALFVIWCNCYVSVRKSLDCLSAALCPFFLFLELQLFHLFRLGFFTDCMDKTGAILRHLLNVSYPFQQVLQPVRDCMSLQTSSSFKPTFTICLQKGSQIHLESF